MYRRESIRHRVVRLKGGKGDFEALYRAYYSLRPPIKPPSNIQKREFAFQLWGSTSYIRHLSFDSPEALMGFLVEKAPRQAYYSIALYQLPEAPSMEEKGWLGSPLLFDIDADHLPGCEGMTGPVDECIVKAARATDRLVSILKRDFGVSRVRVSFTGNRGFHVIAECDWCMELPGEARRLVAEYVMARGLDVTVLFPEKRGRAVPAAPSPEDPGWRGWIALALKTRGGEPLPSVAPSPADVHAAAESMAVPVDLQVTQDPTRLERIPLTLNGKASLVAVEVEDLASFRPGRELSPFRGEALVRARQRVEARMLGVSLALEPGEEAELPGYAAITLASLGLADLLGGEVVVRRDAGWRPV